MNPHPESGDEDVGAYVQVVLRTGPDGYDLACFADPEYLSPVVRYDLQRIERGRARSRR